MEDIKQHEGQIRDAGEQNFKGHGGKRIKGLGGVSAHDHDSLESDIESFADQWFLTEKAEYANQCPNPNPNQKGIYQIDDMFQGDYYELFCSDMKDLYHLSEDKIASQTVWKKVWDERHSDLVMRVRCSVDSKDRVSCVLIFMRFQP